MGPNEPAIELCLYLYEQIEKIMEDSLSLKLNIN